MGKEQDLGPVRVEMSDMFENFESLDAFESSRPEEAILFFAKGEQPYIALNY